MLLLLALAGCGGRPEAPGPGPEEVSGTACRAALAATGARFTAWVAPQTRSCRVDMPVRLLRTTLALGRPLDTSCAMALAWTRFEPQLRKLAVQQIGSDIATVSHFGSYSCRRMTGNASRLSLHASARALDIAGFTLADGRTVSVARDWGSWGRSGRFLRSFVQAACRRFSVVLDPKSDAQHRDHVHVDIGPWRRCE